MITCWREPSKSCWAGNELYLQPGDSLYYDSSLPHVMYAVEGDCRFIAVVIKEGAKA